MADTSKLILDVTNVLSGLDQIDAATLETSRNFAKMADAAKKAGSDVNASFKVGAAQGVVDALNDLQKEYADTKRSADVLRIAMKQATEPAAVKVYAAALGVLDDELARLEKSGKAAGVNLKELNKTASGGQQIFSGLAKFAGAAGAIFAAIQGGSQVVAATREFEKLFATLKQATGNELKAKELFSQIQEFAKETPFQLNEVVGAFVKLENRNFNPTVEQLRTLGDIASSQGKSLDQFVEAVLDAQTGEFERLKEFGIVARKEGDNIRATFRGQETTFKNNGKAITDYLLELGKLPGIQGSAVAVAQTLDGSISNLTDNFAQLFKNIGSGGGVLKGFVDAINTVVSGINELIETPLSEELQQQQVEFNALIGVLQDTTTEETQRNAVIATLKKEYPGYLKFVNDDAKGQLDLAKTLLEGNKLFEARILLQATEEQRVNLTKQKLAAETELTKALTEQQKVRALGERTTAAARNEAGDLAKSENVQAQAQRRVAELRAEIDGLQNQITSLVSDADQTAIRTTGKSLAELQAQLAETKKEAEETNAGGGDTGKKKLASEIELARLRAELMQKGLEQEIAFENVRFLEQKAALEKTFAGRKELHGLVETAEQAHQENISRIQFKYFRDRVLKIAEELEAEKASIQRGLDEIGALQEEERARLAANAKRNAKAQEDADALAKETFEASLLVGREAFFEKKRTDKEVEEYEKNVAKAREIFQLELQRNELQRALDFGQDLSSAEKATLEQRIKNINTQISQITRGVGDAATGGDKKPFDIFSLFIDPNDPDFQKKKDGLIKAAEEVVGALQAMSAARLEAAQAAVDAAETELDTAESKTEDAQKYLDEQQALQDQGFANNVKAAEDDLKAAEQAEAQKKAQRDKAVQDQQRAQKAQIVLDGVLQLNNIITSASNIIKGFSVIPIVGGPLGIAAAAAMIAGFIGAKVKAFQAVNAQKFRHGGDGFLDSSGFVHGRTHEQGGELLEVERGEMVQVGKDGSRTRVAIVRREGVRDYFDLLTAANKGDKKALAFHAARLAGQERLDIPHPAAVTIPTPTISIPMDREGISRRLFDTEPAGNNGADMEEITAALKRNNALLEQILSATRKQSDKGEWSSDGKTFRAPGIVKRYI